MKSKQALEEIIDYIKYKRQNEHIPFFIKLDIDDINKDLDKLEKMNDVWHKNEPMESVDINGNHLQEIYDFRNRLIDENDKLQKVIEILKTKTVVLVALTLSKDLDDYIRMTSFENLTQEEYELLKEVLEND